MLVLDHLVYAVPDLEVAIADFEACLGALPLHGGRHTALGSWNAILPLRGEVYVELIAADPGSPDPAGPRPFGLDELGSARLVTWAARTTDLDTAARDARERGFDPGAIVAVGRDLPGGGRLDWRLTLRLEAAADGLVPFLIDWGDAPHPSTVSPATCRLERFGALHPDPQSPRAMLDALGVSLTVEAGERAQLRATVTGPRGSLQLLG